MTLKGRLGVSALLALLLAALGASAAYGGKPTREPAESGSFSFPAGMVCPFAVDGEVAANRQTETTFSSGKVAITGFFASRLIANGKEITLVTPGPVFISPGDDGPLHLKATGPIIFFFFPGDAGPGDTSTGRTYLFKGHVEVVIDPATFEFLEFGYRGQATDLCEALAV
jgi:hypothetical protein